MEKIIPRQHTIRRSYSLKFGRHEEQLLKACLSKNKEEAVSNWNAFCGEVGLDAVEHGGRRLLPLVYKNLRGLGADAAGIDICKGVHKLTWCKNQKLFHKADKVLGLFHEAGIKIILFKGAAFVIEYYKDFGLRPMDDFDILVPVRDLDKAVRILQEAGWKPHEDKPLNDLTKKILHAYGFIDRDGEEIDLHWHLFPQFSGDEDDFDFWDAAVPIRYNGRSLYTLNPADHLLQVLVNGASWNPVVPLRWVADAAFIIENAAGGIDWKRVIEQAHKRRLIVPVRDNAHYLRERFGLKVPVEVLDTMDAVAVSELEKKLYREKSRPFGLFGYLPGNYLQYLVYLKSRTNNSAVFNVATFFEFLRCYWGEAHLWKLPWSAVAKLPKGLRRKLTKQL